MNNGTKKALQGFLIGAAAGVVAGILLAPASGKESRKKLNDSAKDLKGKLNNQLDETLSKLSDFTETTLSSLKNVAKGEKVSNN